jgi:DNA primase
LAKKYGIIIEEKEQTTEDIERNSRRESLMVVSAYATRTFHENLFDDEQGKAVGMSYFKERGFRQEVISKFELGFCLEARDSFTRKALKDGYKEEFLIETGLTIKGEHGLFDRFFGRAMFPIHSLSGKVVAFGGRTLKSDKKIAKYLNSPESEIYHKSKVLYGIFQAKASIIKADKCFLVEGYTDVLSLHQSGIENVVASSGTALTIEQIQLIKRFTSNITVLYDGDSAGIKAALRGIDLILQEGLNVKVLLLPEGEDPDSFARTNSAAKMQDYIADNETDFIKFKAQLLLEDAKDDPIKKSQLITDVVQSISLIPQAITRSVYLQQCAQMFQMDETMLTETANSMRQKGTGERKTSEKKEEKPTIVDATSQKINKQQKEIFIAEREIIRIMLRYGQRTLTEQNDDEDDEEMTVAQYIIADLSSDELDLLNPLLHTIFDEYRQILEDGQFIDEKYFLQHINPEISKLAAAFEPEPKYELSKIHYRNGGMVKTDDNNLLETVPASTLAYKSKRVVLRLDEISQEMNKPENIEDADKFETLCRQYQQLSTIKKTLGLTLGKRVYN